MAPSAPSGTSLCCRFVQITAARRRAVALALALPTSLLAACGNTTVLPLTNGTPKPDLVALLDNMPQGVARLQVDTRLRRIVAHLDVTGIAPSTAHALQLRRGTCLQRGGALVSGFDDARSTSIGAINADVRGTTANTAIPSGVHLELHATPNAQTNAQSIPIACMDIPAATPTAPVRVYATPGYKPFGTAQIDYDKTQRAAKLTLALDSLIPSSIHAVQILDGSCAQPGTLLHALGDVAADRNGTAKATQVFGVATLPPSKGWILMIRTGPASSLGTQQQPTLQAQPLLCGPIAKPA
jgi:hypothetical protein